MNWQVILRHLKWSAFLGVLSGLLIGTHVLRSAMHGDSDEPDAPPPRLQGTVVVLSEESIERYELKSASAQEMQWYPRTTIYGRVVPNPRATVEVRVPFAGTLRMDAAERWPSPGQAIKAQQRLGWIDVRVGPELREDYLNRLSDARSRQHGAEEEIELQKNRIRSLEEVTSSQILARNDLDLALIQLAQAKAQLASASAAAEQWQKTLAEIDKRTGRKDALWSEVILAPADGEVTELAGQPGMAVEAGSVIAQIVDFRHPLVRLDIPPDLLGGSPPREIVLLPTSAGSAAQPGILDARRAAANMTSVKAALVGPAPHVDSATQFLTFWYAVKGIAAAEPVNAGAVMWRPGLQVKAELVHEEGNPIAAVAIPQGAVLYHEGNALVYVQTGPTHFERRQVQLLAREADHWIVARHRDDRPGGIDSGEAVVYQHAQILLSEEFRGESPDDD